MGILNEVSNNDFKEYKKIVLCKEYYCTGEVFSYSK
jgi:hypothetical protein